MALPCLQWVVLLAVVVCVKELLEPLDELKVVLEFTLHEPLHWNDLQSHGARRQIETTVKNCAPWNNQNIVMLAETTFTKKTKNLVNTETEQIFW